VGSSFTVPIINGGEIQGLLTLGAADPDGLPDRARGLPVSRGQPAGHRVDRPGPHAATGGARHLTGLYNRKGLEEEFQRIWMMGRRYHWAVGVAVIDIDEFKNLNDTYGHLRGDEILREFSRVVERVARESDIIGRYGGDEVVVVLPQAGAADCIAFGERLLYALRHHVFCEKTTGGLQLSASIGVATSMGVQDDSSEQLLSHADMALYMAKKQGRNRVCIHQADQVPAPRGATPGTGGDRSPRTNQNRAPGAAFWWWTMTRPWGPCWPACCARGATK
jgi:diguanylate cyclase (GGDEF)-like protein